MTNHDDHYYRASSFRRIQLPTTLQRAVDHPFYQQYWRDQRAALRRAASAAEAWELLAELPVLTRTHLAEQLMPHLQDGDEIVGIGFSSGSRGKITSRYFSERERASSSQLFAPPARRPGRKKVVRLEFVSTWHGVNTDRASNSLLLPGAISTDSFVERTIQMLRLRLNTPNTEESATIISGSIYCIHAFTRYLIDHGIPASEFTIRCIGAYGGYIGRRRRMWLEDYWRCAIVDNFSVSECRGKATICPQCGYLAFDPQLVPLVLDLNSDAPVATGIGRLTLTELHPFGIVQPVVKYLTNDLVERIERGSACCEAHADGLRRVGRMETSILAEMGQRRIMLLASQDLYDAFDREGVHREQSDQGIQSIRYNDLAQPFVQWRHQPLDSGKHRLVFEFRPEAGSRSATVRSTARSVGEAAAQFLATQSRTASLIRQGELEVDVRDNTLTPAPPYKFA